MLTKVVEPGLGFLVLFTDPRSDDALASYDVSKFQLSIAGYSQCIISDISNRLRYGANGCQVHSRKGVPWSVRMIAAGVRLNEPQIFFAKISKDEKSSFDVDVGILKPKIEILFFCTKTQEIDRQIILASDWRRKIAFWRRHIGHSIQKWSITGKDLVQPQNYFPGNGSKQCNRGWGIRKSRSRSSGARCLRCSECRTRKFKNR